MPHCVERRGGAERWEDEALVERERERHLIVPSSGKRLPIQGGFKDALLRPRLGVKSQRSGIQLRTLSVCGYKPNSETGRDGIRQTVDLIMREGFDICLNFVSRLKFILDSAHETTGVRDTFCATPHLLSPSELPHISLSSQKAAPGYSV